MGSNGQLHLVRADVLKPVITALPVSLTRLETILENAGLPAALSGEQNGAVAQNAAEKLLCDSTKLMACPTFGFQIVPILNPELDAYMASLPVQTGGTGLSSAHDLVANIDALLTGDKIFGTAHKELFWIKRTLTASDWTQNWAVIQFSLAVFLSGMRQMFGGNLAQRALLLPRSVPANSLPEPLRGVPRTIEPGMAGIAFDINDLCRVIKTRRHKTIFETQSNTLPLYLADKSNLAACAVGFLRSGSSGMLAQRMAASFGVSLRSYQRRLSDIGTTHSELVDSARLELALRMLAEETCSVTEIALELGYSYPGHFTRFFKQRVGISPSEYRKVEVNG